MFRLYEKAIIRLHVYYFVMYRVIEKDGRDLKRYNVTSTRRIYRFGILKCSEKFKVLDLP